MIHIELLNSSSFEKNIDSILNLFKLSFSTPMTKEDLKWRYLGNPYADLNIVVAIKEDEIVGFIGTAPTRLSFKDKKIKTCMLLNMMTHPEYCRQGIFSKMIKKLEEALKIKGYDFIYSFPNFQSNHILIEKHNWKDIYEIPRLELQQEKLHGMEFRNDLAVVEDHSYKCDYFISDSTNSKFFIRNESYRQWRIKNNPSGNYDNFACLDDQNNIKGFITIRKYKDEYNIVEVSFQNIEILYNLLKYAIMKFKNSPYHVLTAWYPTNTQVHSAFEKLGFINKYPITYFAGKVIGNFAELQNVYSWDKWVIQAIDDNIY